MSNNSNDDVSYDIARNIQPDNMWVRENEFLICMYKYNIVLKKINEPSFMFAINRHPTTYQIRVMKIGPLGECIYCKYQNLTNSCEYNDIRIYNYDVTLIKIYFDGMYGTITIIVNDFLRTYETHELVLSVTHNVI